MSSVVISGDTSGSITLSAPAVSGSNTITLPAATGELSMLGGSGQTWQNVAGSRSIGTTYYNTTGKPIQIYASIVHPSSGSAVSTMVVNTSAIGSINNNLSGTNIVAVHSSIIPSGESYSINVGSGSPTVSSWFELR